jgi:sterol desaturase/sphingolipid hydroxylase (fatty acid hydroxylase superfamily)
VMTLFAYTGAVHGIFQHANLPLKLGPLNWFFSMAELHRWHHSTVLEEANSNYGQNLIVWDIVYGTRSLPKDREPPEKIGINGMPNFPMRYWKQLMSPFQWQRIKNESQASD